MKKTLSILILLLSFYISYSQTNIRTEAVIDKLLKNNFNQNYLDTYCIHFYYNNELYVLSYSSDINYKNASQRDINLYKRVNDNWNIVSELIFVSSINYSYSIDFMDYPYPKLGNAITKVLDNNTILITMSYREYIMGHFYNYPIFVLFIPNNDNKSFKSLIFIPTRINNRYAIKINDNYLVLMNDKTNIKLDFNYLNMNNKYNIKFTDDLGSITGYKNY